MWLSIVKVVASALFGSLFDKAGQWLKDWQQQRLEAKAAKATLDAANAAVKAEVAINKATANAPKTNAELLDSQKKGDF